MGYHRIATILQDKSASGGATISKRGPTGGAQSRSVVSNLSLRCVIRLLRALFRYFSLNQSNIAVLRLHPSLNTQSLVEDNVEIFPAPDKIQSLPLNVVVMIP